ncbi:MAG TPA: hypothetical protein VFM61_07425, partial [Pseudidiomarina sp.]|nr:hypothetical protein [Pseudidiomarina sp.]
MPGATHPSTSSRCRRVFASMAGTLLAVSVSLASLVVTPAFAQIAPPVDEQLEQEIDALLSSMNGEPLDASYLELLAKVDESTPLATRIRLYAYLAFEEAYANNFEGAWDYIELAESLINESTLADITTEVLASRIE